MIRPGTILTLGAVTVATFGGFAAMSGAAGKTIAVDDDFFSPKSATVAKNTLVTFRWRGESAHNIKHLGGLRFKSAPLKSTGTHKVRLTRAGTYRYVCTIHDGMTGRIVVK